ncbi:MAG TPA: ABC transporter, partial [Ruminococcaceae bacterium]|nr:ABC transporter [Oscillospiraceae bacterium]
MALITCDNISLAYENNVVLSDLSFSVHAGDYLCIVGENGSGKSTLIKALLSFKRPLCGSIQFGDGLRQTEIGYLPQQTGA